MDAWGFDPLHVIAEIIGAGVVVWAALRQDRKERKKEAELLEERQERRHDENRRNLENISMHLAYNPPHVHMERSGNLQAEGIRYSAAHRRPNEDED